MREKTKVELYAEQVGELKKALKTCIALASAVESNPEEIEFSFKLGQELDRVWSKEFPKIGKFFREMTGEGKK